MRKSLVAAILLSLAANSAFADDVSRSDQIDLSGGKSLNAAIEMQDVRPKQQVTQAQVSKADPFDEFNGKPLGRVIITGNKQVPVEAIGKLVKSKPGDTVTEELIRNDLFSIYSDGWCQDVKPSFELENDAVTVTYHYMEAPIITDVDLQGATVLNVDAVRKQFVTGRIMNRKEINEKLSGIIKQYNEAGYTAVTINNGVIDENGVFHVQVTEGKIAAFKVEGNKKTKDYVVLREMRQKVGEPFNANLMKRALQRVSNLGFFNNVGMKANSGPTPDTIEIVVVVEEGNAATASLGFGYSDEDGVVGNFTIQDKNFMGQGDNASFRWEFDCDHHNKNYEISYTRPWIDDKETMATFTIYDLNRETADYDREGHEIARYDKRALGQELTLSRAGSEYTRNYVSLRHKNDKYDEPEKGYSRQYYEKSFNEYLEYPGSPYYKYNGKWPSSERERRKENFGESWSVQFMHVYDSRDNYLFPRVGKRMSYSAEYGFAGDFDYTKWDADWRYYYPVGASVFAWDTEIGYATGDLPLSSRFAVGGTNFLRGYENNQFRGNSMLRTSVEFRSPLTKNITGVLFSDYGYAWDKRDEDNFDLDKMKFGYGVGIRAETPMGMLRLDYGIGEKKNRFHFSFGGSF